MVDRPLILVTNDDGISAAGIAALSGAMVPLGDVWVVAPDRERSGVGHAITLHDPIRVKPAGEQRFACDGTPTDCVFLGVHALLPRTPDLVVSGINHGPNLADDVTYSGTVSGAMEGAIMGVPSIAFSLLGGADADFRPAAELAVAVAQWVLERGLPARTVLNVNIPDTQGQRLTGFRWTRAGVRDYGHAVIQQQDPRGRTMYWIGSQIGFEPLEGSDCNAVQEGVAALTPIYLDMTHHELLGAVSMQDLPGFERR
jgi:5'-nucleotidase